MRLKVDRRALMLGVRGLLHWLRSKPPPAKPRKRRMWPGRIRYTDRSKKE